ncbi:augmin subunit 5 [Quercus suber]|uniref:Augmin subunit 5 n=1 Tax=Quercus suber TaxID=58331 RepID=A0AAW0IEQ4_QUESU
MFGKYFSNTIMIHDGGVVAAELSKVVAGAPQLITIGTDKTLTIWDTISFKDIVTFWNQQPFAARENASSTIIPTCLVVVDISNGGKFLIDKEALLGSMWAIGSTGPGAVAAVEKNAALLTARVGSRDLSAIPSICCVSPALHYAAGALQNLGSLRKFEMLRFVVRSVYTIIEAHPLLVGFTNPKTEEEIYVIKLGAMRRKPLTRYSND